MMLQPDVRKRSESPPAPNLIILPSSYFVFAAPWLDLSAGDSAEIDDVSVLEQPTKVNNANTIPTVQRSQLDWQQKIWI